MNVNGNMNANVNVNVLDHLDIIINNSIITNIENMIDVIMIIVITVTMIKREIIANTNIEVNEIEANAITTNDIMTKAVIITTTITIGNMINEEIMNMEDTVITDVNVIHGMRIAGQDKKSVLPNGLDQEVKTILFGIIDGRLWRCRRRLKLR